MRPRFGGAKRAAVTTVGLDIAKSVFQVHGIDAEGDVIVRHKLKRRQVLALALSEAAAVPGWHRGLCDIALLVAPTHGIRAYRSPDAAGLCKALRQAAEERYC
jgi:hypothetical protein